MDVFNMTYVKYRTVYKLKQDAREAMRVVFSVLAKRICMHKTNFFMNIFKYCFKNYIQLMNLQIATQLIMIINCNNHDENCYPVN